MVRVAVNEDAITKTLIGRCPITGIEELYGMNSTVRGTIYCPAYLEVLKTSYISYGTI
jgi:hypothetical protein